MISAESAISRFRRDLTLGALMRGALLTLAALSLLSGPVLGGKYDATLVLLAVGAVWLVLSYRSMRGSRIVADSPSLIAAGQYDAAEQRIVAGLHAFSLFKTGKLLALHHLAVLRHAQRRWRECAMLARALLRQRPAPASGLARSAHLILADALLESDDLPGAYENIVRLYQQRLSLAEAINLLAVQTEYEARLGAWPAMLARVESKVQLSELMPSRQSATVQALLSLAARRSGQSDLENWLRRRAELLASPDELCARHAMLRELWAQ